MKTKEEIQNIINLYESGLGTIEVGNRLNIGHETVRYYLLKNNIPLRSSSDTWTKKAFLRHDNLDFFNIIDTQEKAYWLGFIYADGSIKNTTLRINLSIKDIDHLSKISKIFNSKITKTIKTCNLNNVDYEGCSTFISSKYLINSLVNLGICENKTYLDSEIIFDNIPDHLMNHFIRGFFDGDGSFSIVNDRVKGISFVGQPIFLNRLKNEIISNVKLNIKVNLHDQETCSILSFGGVHQIFVIVNWIYSNANIYLDRKYLIFKEKLIYQQPKEKTSKFKGVLKDPDNMTFKSFFDYEGKTIIIDYSYDEQYCAKIRDLITFYYFGENLNRKYNFQVSDIKEAMFMPHWKEILNNKIQFLENKYEIQKQY